MMTEAAVPIAPTRNVTQLINFLPTWPLSELVSPCTPTHAGTCINISLLSSLLWSLSVSSLQSQDIVHIDSITWRQRPLGKPVESILQEHETFSSISEESLKALFTQNWKLCHHLHTLMLFQTLTACFWGTQKENFRLILASFFSMQLQWMVIEAFKLQKREPKAP